MILSETAFNTSLKDIGRRFNVSDKTVQRIIDEEAKMHKKSLPEHLPKHMAFDEFMSTDKMSFIWLDSDNHRTGDILPRRTSYQIITNYFNDLIYLFTLFKFKSFFILDVEISGVLGR